MTRPVSGAGARSRWVRWTLPLVVILSIGVYVGRRPSAQLVSQSRFLMDTLVTVSLWAPRAGAVRGAFEGAFGALDEVDRSMARVKGHPLWDLNLAGGGVLDPSTGAVLEAALNWAETTDGAFDPTVAPLIDLWDVSAGPHPPPSDERIRTVRQRVGWRRVKYDPASRRADLGGAAVDLGAIAKGYALDRAALALRAAGVDDFIVNAGGDLYVAGSKGGRPWRVGIQHPRDPDTFLRIVEPREGALVTSGDYERFYLWEGQRVHHILDPRSGRSAAGCRSVTVWAPTAMTADALSTAVFVEGPARGLALVEGNPTAEALVVDAAGSSHETAGFAGVAPSAGDGR